MQATFNLIKIVFLLVFILSIHIAFILYIYNVNSILYLQEYRKKKYVSFSFQVFLLLYKADGIPKSIEVNYDSFP